MGMRKLLIVILVLVFALNGVVSAAWAATTVSHSSFQMEISVDMPEAAMADCHEMSAEAEQNNSEKSTEHCQGLCLCVHAATSSVFNLSDAVDLTLPMIYGSFVLGQEAQPHSAQTPPLKRPPRA